MGKVIDGRSLARIYKEEIKEKLLKIKEIDNIEPVVANILIGSDGGSKYYFNSENKVFGDLGIKIKNFIMEDTVEENEIIDLIEKLNVDCNVHGIMLFLPLPVHLNQKRITSAISYKKDLDGLTDINIGKLYKGEKCFIPNTPRSVIELIKSTGIDINGKNVVVLGRSNIVGKPCAQLLLNENATVTICHSKTKDIEKISSTADILVSGIGKPKFVNRNFIKFGAIVIDVGTSNVNGKITGDVDFDDVLDVASYVSPVPGGVGSLTILMLACNLCEAIYYDN
ncbi:MAG: tetrahydrofolate dehydrogenase/cyclohydrolase catalytic domain-containing protein [Clostridiaceae bacterium]